MHNRHWTNDAVGYTSSGMSEPSRMGIKLVCIDVDGTLVGTSGQVVERVWRSIDAARVAGLRVALCSGRPAFGITREYADRVAPNGWHVFQNGASILRPSTGESFSTPLAPDVVR